MEERRMSHRVYVNENYERVVEYKVPQEFIDGVSVIENTIKTGKGWNDALSLEFFAFVRVCLLRRLDCIDGKAYSEYLENIEEKLVELNKIGALKEPIGSLTGTAQEIIELFLNIVCSYRREDDLENADFIAAFFDEPFDWIITNLREYISDEYVDDVVRSASMACMFGDVPMKAVLDAFLRLSEHKAKEEYTYIMTDSSGLYKIGRSTNVDDRFNSIKVGNPTIRLCFFINGNYEQELHQCFAEKRIIGEWFKLDASDLDYIKKYRQEKTSE